MDQNPSAQLTSQLSSSSAISSAPASRSSGSSACLQSAASVLAHTRTVPGQALPLQTAVRLPGKPTLNYSCLAMCTEYDEIDSLKPATPPLSESSADSAGQEPVSFTVHLHLAGGARICALRGDRRTSAGRLVHEVRKWYSDLGYPISESQVRLVVGERTIRSMVVKLHDLLAAGNYDDPLVVTAVVRQVHLSDTPERLRPWSSDA